MANPVGDQRPAEMQDGESGRGRATCGDAGWRVWSGKGDLRRCRLAKLVEDRRPAEMQVGESGRGRATCGDAGWQNWSRIGDLRRWKMANPEATPAKPRAAIRSARLGSRYTNRVGVASRIIEQLAAMGA
jgi:hypothetical protein